jgi:anti-anti-sigma regulatory factor
MLRITADQESGSTSLKLEGKLSGQWVDELRRTWSEFRRMSRHRSVVVDLSEVSFIDAEGRELLGLMFRQGAELRSGPLVSMTRLILHRIEQECHESRESREAYAAQTGGI